VHRLSLSVALWLAPNGGVGWFCPLGTAVVLGLVVIAAMAARGGAERRRRSLPAVALVIALLLTTGTLASWFAPFGWVAWGPRLMVPVVPAIVVLTVVLYVGETEQVLRVALGGVGRAVALGAVLVVAALPEVNVLHAGQVVGQLFAPDATCPRFANVAVGPGYYYHCLNHWAWARHVILISTYEALNGPGGMIFAAAFVLVWLSSLCLAGVALRTPREHGIPEAVVAGGPSE
jgi:hypothetical protein